MDGLTEGAEPLDRALAREAPARSFHDCVALLAEHLQADEVGLVAQASGGVLQRELAQQRDPTARQRADLDRLEGELVDPEMTIAAAGRAKRKRPMTD